MENKALPMPVVIGIIVAVVLLVGFFGFRAISGRSTDIGLSHFVWLGKTVS